MIRQTHPSAGLEDLLCNETQQISKHGVKSLSLRQWAEVRIIRLKTREETRIDAHPII